MQLVGDLRNHGMSKLTERSDNAILRGEPYWNADDKANMVSKHKQSHRRTHSCDTMLMRA